MAQTVRAEATTPAGPTLLTSKVCRDQADDTSKPGEPIKNVGVPEVGEAQQPCGADGLGADVNISADGDALGDMTARVQPPADADDAEEEIAAEVKPLGNGADLEAGVFTAADVGLESVVELQAEASSDEEDDIESNLTLEARQAAQAKATSDEVFWTAASLALHERERRERVGAFLKEHGFAGVNSSRGWWSYTYPLHVAAMKGDARLVQLLLDSRAMRRKKDSAGQTARQLAKAANKEGSHDAVVQVLKFSQRRRRRSMPLDTVFSGLPPAVAAVKKAEAPQQPGPPRPSPQPVATVFGSQEVEEALPAASTSAEEELACEV